MEFYFDGCMCPACEVGTLSLVERDLEFEYKDEKLLLTRKVWECSACQESFLQAKDKPEVEKILTDRRRRVDGLLISEEITDVREQLHLTTAEFAKILRISEKDIAYYESGRYTQSYELDDVFRILRAYPEAINVLKQDSKDARKKATKRRSKPLAAISVEEMTPQLVKV